MQVYDGVRRRALPVLLDALKPGTDDDRMKGALWTLNLSPFGEYAISGNFFPKFFIIWIYLTFKVEPTLANDLLLRLFGCQHQEKVFLFQASLDKSFYSYLAINSRMRLESLWELWGCLALASYSLADHITGLSNFVEPSNAIYDIPTPDIDRAIDKLKKLLRAVVDPKEEDIKIRAQEMRIKRARILDEAVEIGVSMWYQRCKLI